MMFNSVSFFLFLGAVGLTFYLFPLRYRWLLLLAANCIFYSGFGADSAGVLLALIGVCYFCALGIGGSKAEPRRKAFLIIGLLTNLGVLAGLKYLDFFVESALGFLAFLGAHVEASSLRVLIPIGISFFVFRGVSYLVDVYRGNLLPERHFGILSAHLSFFPSLVCGPIDRGGDLIPQLRSPVRFDPDRLASGVRLMAWGLFKKVVVADQLGLYVDAVFNNLAHHTGPTFLVATYFYAFQIYCDFSGYTDLAIGAARLLGYDLRVNFNLPYFSTTIRDFWRRWHISLSTWIRDYLYIPLGGSRGGATRTFVNGLVVMSLCGLWHGAAWSFVVWGALHGLLLALSRLSLPWRDGMYRRAGAPAWLVSAIRRVITFHLVCLLWVLFRAPSLGDAGYVITHLFRGWPNLFIDQACLSQGLLGLGLLVVVETVQFLDPAKRWWTTRPVVLRWAFYYIVAFAIILLGVDGGAQFIYSQF
jgi:alginate O-acetyltransferase complex protein AlgI